MSARFQPCDGAHTGPLTVVPSASFGLMDDDPKADLRMILDPVTSEWDVQVSIIGETHGRIRTAFEAGGYGTAREHAKALSDLGEWFSGTGTTLAGLLDKLTD